MTIRLREGDCLSEIRKDLARQAATVRVWEAEEYRPWVASCAELLATVPDELQRIAWAWSLAQALLAKIVGIPHSIIIETLLVGAATRARRRRSRRCMRIWRTCRAMRRCSRDGLSLDLLAGGGNRRGGGEHIADGCGVSARAAGGHA